MIVRKHVQSWPPGSIKQAATLPVQVLSGRTGDLLWRHGPLPLPFQAQGYSQINRIAAHSVEPTSPPDLFVRHGSPFVKPGTTPPPGARSFGMPSLARISGRDGRILWDIPLADGPSPDHSQLVPPDSVADLNGNGALDMVLIVPPIPGAGQPEYVLRTISLRDGKRLWSLPLNFPYNSVGDFFVGDLDGDKRADVVVVEELLTESNTALEVRAFDGRDGRLRWTWNGGPQFKNNRTPHWSVLANLDGDGRQKVCLNFQEWNGASPDRGR